MTIKVGINGFGRIGRMVFRAAVQNFSDIEVVGINDLLEPDYLAYMLKYDSVHGRFKGEVSVDGNTLVVNGKRIRLTQERDPANLKWTQVGADIVPLSPVFALTEGAPMWGGRAVQRGATPRSGEAHGWAGAHTTRLAAGH